jgi:hypothetical protein
MAGGSLWVLIKLACQSHDLDILAELVKRDLLTVLTFNFGPLVQKPWSTEVSSYAEKKLVILLFCNNGKMGTWKSCGTPHDC